MATTPSTPALVHPQFAPEPQRPQAMPAVETYRMRFHGTGGAFFALLLKNVLLSIVTLWIYTAWAKVARRKFLWQNIEVHGQRLQFTGTGAELFLAYVKVGLGYLGALAFVGLAGAMSKTAGIVAQGVLVLGFLFLVPFLIY